MFQHSVENQEAVMVMIENLSVEAPMCSCAIRALKINYPSEFDKASKIADITIDTMERNVRKLPAFSIEEICYWIKLGTYAHIIIDRIKEHGIKIDKTNHL